MDTRSTTRSNDASIAAMEKQLESVMKALDEARHEAKKTDARLIQAEQKLQAANAVNAGQQATTRTSAPKIRDINQFRNLRKIC